tara:strand:- start:714 stop:908 length:195 start_codon:yes stop_codon:yes gene_type:complete
MLKLKLFEVGRKFLVDVAKSSDSAMTEEMAAFIKKLTTDGMYTEASEDEIELFDRLLEEMENLE